MVYIRTWPNTMYTNIALCILRGLIETDERVQQTQLYRKYSNRIKKEERKNNMERGRREKRRKSSWFFKYLAVEKPLWICVQFFFLFFSLSSPLRQSYYKLLRRKKKENFILMKIYNKVFQGERIFFSFSQRLHMYALERA